MISSCLFALRGIARRSIWRQLLIIHECSF